MTYIFFSFMTLEEIEQMDDTKHILQLQLLQYCVFFFGKNDFSNCNKNYICIRKLDMKLLENSLCNWHQEILRYNTVYEKFKMYIICNLPLNISGQKQWKHLQCKRTNFCKTLNYTKLLQTFSPFSFKSHSKFCVITKTQDVQRTFRAFCADIFHILKIFII